MFCTDNRRTHPRPAWIKQEISKNEAFHQASSARHCHAHRDRHGRHVLQFTCKRRLSRRRSRLRPRDHDHRRADDHNQGSRDHHNHRRDHHNLPGNGLLRAVHHPTGHALRWCARSGATGHARHRDGRSSDRLHRMIQVQAGS